MNTVKRIARAKQPLAASQALLLRSRKRLPTLALVLCCLVLPFGLARAEDVVDSPMYRDPDLPMPRVVKSFSDRFPALWVQALDRPEADFRCQAALTIAEAR